MISIAKIWWNGMDLVGLAFIALMIAIMGIAWISDKIQRKWRASNERQDEIWCKEPAKNICKEKLTCQKGIKP